MHPGSATRVVPTTRRLRCTLGESTRPAGAPPSLTIPRPAPAGTRPAPLDYPRPQSRAEARRLALAEARKFAVTAPAGLYTDRARRRVGSPALPSVAARTQPPAGGGTAGAAGMLEVRGKRLTGGGSGAGGLKPLPELAERSTSLTKQHFRGFRGQQRAREGSLNIFNPSRVTRPHGTRRGGVHTLQIGRTGTGHLVTTVLI